MFTFPLVVRRSIEISVSVSVKTWRHPQNRKYITYCIAVGGGPRLRAKATDNMQAYRKFGDIWTCVFETREQTDRTDTLISGVSTGETGGRSPDFRLGNSMQKSPLLYDTVMHYQVLQTKV